MSNVEFANICAKIALVTGKSLSAEAQAEYFRLLGDLSAKVFQAAADRVAQSHVWATFPSVAEFRQAANALATGDMTGQEAYAIAREAARRIDPEIRGTYRVYLGNGKHREYPSYAASIFETLKVPAAVVKAIEVYGIHELCNPDSPDGVIRSQFVKIFETIREREQRTAAIPAPVRQMLGEKSDDGELLKKALTGIGEMPK